MGHRTPAPDWEQKAKLKNVCPNKCYIELQMLIVIPSAPILQNPMLYAVIVLFVLVLQYSPNFLVVELSLAYNINGENLQQ
jgi:hypothetical protein